jgi:hypothetical protein
MCAPRQELVVVVNIGDEVIEFLLRILEKCTVLVVSGTGEWFE